MSLQTSGKARAICSLAPEGKIVALITDPLESKEGKRKEEKQKRNRGRRRSDE